LLIANESVYKEETYSFESTNKTSEDSPELVSISLDKAFGSLLYSLADETSYIRIQDIGDSFSLLKAHLSQRALVIDLRFVRSDPESIHSLGNLLSIHSRPSKSPRTILVLCNKETSPPLGKLLQDLQNEGSIIAIGTSPNETGFTPKLNVNVLPEKDHKAYHALGQTMDMKALINGTVVKDRYDEARLMKDFQNNQALKGQHQSVKKEKPSIAEEDSSPPLTDDILQRAYFLIKALEGLGKLSSI
ncbi:MAG: hypothetical protein JKY51_01665, partial [Opitutaceae bacterium]|nr:hypothetical protein [Opitutaceae bacterium]